MAWDPDRYLQFADHRMRPGSELILRIPDIEPALVVDLGSGTGNLTAMLAARWPEALVLGVDSSEEMLGRARGDVPGVDWQLADIASWVPPGPVDLLFSNATLHWLDGHASLFRRLRTYLAPGGVMAVQMPDNWDAPTHRIPAEILDEPGWPDHARSVLMRRRLSRPSAYIDWVQPATVDVWRTTYYQRLTGDQPVWRWVTGSVLRPVLETLDGSQRDHFEHLCRAAYDDAYPMGADGMTTLPFSRLFIVARAG